jgi:hypothetical protein
LFEAFLDELVDEDFVGGNYHRRADREKERQRE